MTLALFASGKIRASKRATKIFMIAMIGYLVFSLVNLGLMIFNVPIAGGAFGLVSQPSFLFGIPWGVLIGVFVVIMAAYSLVLDFDGIQQGVRNGAPASVRLAGRLRHHGHGRLAVRRDPAHPRDRPRLELAAQLSTKGPSERAAPLVFARREHCRGAAPRSPLS